MKKITLIGFGNIWKKYFKAAKKIKNISIKNILKKKLNLNLKNIEFFTKLNKNIKDNSDAYIIASPINTHFYYLRKIIKLKKPFIIEKPIVADLKQLYEIKKLCKNYQYPILVNYSDLYNPAFIEFEKKIKTIGNYKEIDITFGKIQKKKLI